MAAANGMSSHDHAARPAIRVGSRMLPTTGIFADRRRPPILSRSKRSPITAAKRLNAVARTT